MKCVIGWIIAGVSVLCCGCSRNEVEAEPNYDEMVMDDEDEDWTSDEEKDRKVVLSDHPDPQELLIVEPQTHSQ